MARAKNTDRAEARRRYRDQQRETDAPADPTPAEDATAAPAAPASVGSTMFGSLRMPDVRADLRIMPGMLRTSRKLWIPFGLLLAAFVLAMLLTQVTTSESVVDGQTVTTVTSTVFPEGVDRIAALFVQLTLPPTALFIFFIGGFLAPRASYLVGALLGLVDGLLWSIYVLVAQSSAGLAGATASEGPAASSFVDVLVIIVIAVLIGTLAAGFAAWYRNFLRQSSERARQNRMAREQAARAKAKEDERKEREEQRRSGRSASTAKGSSPPPST